MTTLTIGYIVIIFLIIFLIAGLQIGVAMGLLGFVGIAMLSGWSAALGVLKTVPYPTLTDYGFSVIPLFIIMGEFCFVAGISGDLYEAAHKFLGNLRGGLAMATIGACSGFAAVSGSSVATAATIGTIALPQMKKYKYDPALAAGTVAAGGTIGVLIPPSVSMVVYGIITEQSIGKLFLAGFVPGVIQALLFIGAISIICFFNPYAGPPGPGTTVWEKIRALKSVGIIIILFLLVIGGLYTGIFSPTEAAGVGACGAFVFALFKKRLNWEKFSTALTNSVKTAAMIFFILVGSMVFGYFLAISRLPSQLMQFLADLHMNKFLVWGIIMTIYLFLGCIMDALAMIVLTVPITFPVITALGFDPIWFGIMVVILGEAGMITPPVGINVFIIKGIASDVPTITIFRGIFPFVLVDVCLLILFTIWPQIVLVLPAAMK